MTVKRIDRNIDYGKIVDTSMRSIVRRVLKLVEDRDGTLPGNHHFYITVDLYNPNVEISQELKDKHGDKITIVIQHQFSNLKVERKYFEIILSFGGKDEHMIIPFDSIISFADPSCSFGLQFDDQGEGEAEAMEELELTIDFDDDEELLENEKMPEKKPEKTTDKADKKENKKGKKPAAKKAKKKDNSKVISLDSFRKK